MIKKSTRYFNTSGPNIPEEHYTIQRKKLILEGIELVKKKRYFTIWAPRQTGKSTYFRQLHKELHTIGYKAVHFSVEGFTDYSAADMFDSLCREMKDQAALDILIESFKDFEKYITNNKNDKIVLIVDEIESLNPALVNQFLHTIRNLYHFREKHCLHSVILVGVSNIVGIISDNASPFNIADNLDVPYFTKEEAFELLHMHEQETGQIFEDRVKEKISEITANQPGLVNGFANRLVCEYADMTALTYEQYLATEKWFLQGTVDKNISNIINKAKKHQEFIEKLLFNDDPEEFRINDEKIKFLSSYGVITSDEDYNIVFNVPLYKKALIDAFSPSSNGESKYFFSNMEFSDFFHSDGSINFDNLIHDFKEYVKLRSFRYFREKETESGKPKHIKEAALIYTFETYIDLFLRTIKAKTYLEPHTGLGISDLIINYEGAESVVEAKVFRNSFQFKKGKTQLAYYCNSIKVTKGIYLVFLANRIKTKAAVETREEINGVEVTTYVVTYDEEKDF
ncbi:MAG: ATP-binding protein [bacterium]|nr:ATP-binding protein [bacterium]